MPTIEAHLLSTPTHSSESSHIWLKYALASFFFGAIGQFSMGFLSEDVTSRYIISLGDFLFVVFWCFLKYIYFRIQNQRWANIKDCAWIDSETGYFKKGSFKYLLLCVTTRFLYGYTIVIAFAAANSEKMNLGIILSVRSGEALFAALWTYLYLKEKLSGSKLLGLFILTGGVVGLSLPKGAENSGFSLVGIMWALLAALVSSFRNFAVKSLATLKIDGDTIIIHVVFWADLLTVIIGIISNIWGMGFNHEFYDKYLHENSVELTWRRFGISFFVGFAIFFSLSTTANATQTGYTGPAVAIKNSSLLAVTILAWLFLDQDISYLQWIFIGVLLIGLFITSAGDSIIKGFKKEKNIVNNGEKLTLEFKEIN